MKAKLLGLSLLLSCGMVTANEYKIAVTTDTEAVSVSDYIELDVGVPPVVEVPRNKCEDGEERVDIARLKQMIADNEVGLETVCTEGITKMNNLFFNLTTFNRDISGWDVSNVTDMSYMFMIAKKFNQDLSK